MPLVNCNPCSHGPVWSHGQAIKLSEDSVALGDRGVKEWCLDCWIVIMLESKQAGTYALTAKVDLGGAQNIFEGR